MYETQFLVEEGATPQQVDRALTGFGMAMGMFAVDDMAGHRRRRWRVRRRSATSATRASGGRWSTIGWSRWAGSGQKTRHGLVSLRRAAQADAGSRGRGARSGRCAADAGIAQRTISDEEIVERAIYALVNEGARALEAGVAAARLGHRRDLRERLRVPGAGAAGRCSTPIASASATCSPASGRSTASTASAGRRRRCSWSWPRAAARSAAGDRARSR